MNDRIFEQLSFADNKLNFILVSATMLLSGAIAGVISLIVGINWDLSWWKWVILAYLCWMIILFAASVIFCLEGIKPNLNKLDATGKRNIYFYGDIGKFDGAESYLKAIEKNSLEDDLALENIEVSRIVCNKHVNEQYGASLLISGICPIFIYRTIQLAISKK